MFAAPNLQFNSQPVGSLYCSCSSLKVIKESNLFCKVFGSPNALMLRVLDL